MLRFRQGRDGIASLLVEGTLHLYLLTLFVPGATALNRVALWSGLAIWLAACPKDYLRRAPGVAVLASLAVLVALLLASVLASIDSRLSAATLWKTFDDYLFAIPAAIHAVRLEAGRRRLALVLGLCGAVAVGLNAGQYLSEYRRLGEMSSDYFAHRDWTYPLQLFAPFALLLARCANKRRALVWYAVFGIEALMIVATGARGAWLAFGVATGLWFALALGMRAVVLGAAAGLVMLGTGYALLPQTTVKSAFERGLGESGRVAGAWWPAVEMTNQRPLTGFGFGPALFAREYDRQVAAKPHWAFKKSLGPHSMYLETAFAAGYPALAALIALFLLTLSSGLKLYRHAPVAFDRYFALALLCSFAGFYVVRGLVESPRWAPLAILVGATAGLLLHAGRAGGRREATESSPVTGPAPPADRGPPPVP